LHTIFDGIKDTAQAIRSGEPQGDIMVDGLGYVLKKVARDPVALLGLINNLAQQRVDALSICADLKREYGIPIGLISPGGDSTFNLDKIQRAIREKYLDIRLDIAEAWAEKSGPFTNKRKIERDTLLAEFMTDPTLIFDGAWTLREDLDHYSVTAKPQPLVRLFPLAIGKLEAKQPAIKELEAVG